MQFVSPPSQVGNDLDADHDDEGPLRYRRVSNVFGSGPLPGFANRDVHEDILLIKVEETTSFTQVEKDE